MAIPSNPTALESVVYRNKIIAKWIANPETDISGYNIYNSTTSGGGVSGYVKLNTSLLDVYEEVREAVITTTTTTSEVANVRTTTTVDTVQKQYIYSFSHENLTEEVKQYYVVTAVNTLGEESAYSIEIAATPLIVSTDVIDPPLRTQNDVSLDYIATLLDRQPKLDVKPGSETRQLHIDPNSKEFYYAYVRIDFLYKSQSILTLRKMDDSDNDRISDPVSTSSYKQLLKEAYFLQNDSDVQTLIDTAFDKIGSNYGMQRGGTTQSTGEVTFWTNVIPTKDINVPLNSEISTAPTETTLAIKFSTLTEGTIEVANLDAYYNPITQRYELTLPVQAIEAGAAGNVNAAAIIISTISGLNVTNSAPTFGGQDQESNADYADRIQLAFVGLDVGTVNGYKRIATETPNVLDVRVVEAGNQFMQRDYDEVRHKHVFGKVDVYIKGGVETQYVENFGFLYKQSLDEIISIISDVDMIVRSNNPNVSATKAIYNIDEIKNITKAKNYDLTGNWTIYRNTIPMIKVSEADVDLASGLITFGIPLILGDTITADYDYKTTATQEIIVASAGGGETNFTLDFFPVLKFNYIIYKNDIALTETTDYTLNLTNGALSLVAPLIAGNSLKADYIYRSNIVGEVVIASATGTETQANLINQNILESFIIYSDGISIDLDEFNVINAGIGIHRYFTITTLSPTINVGDTYSNNGSVFEVDDFSASVMKAHRISGANEPESYPPIRTLALVSGTGTVTLTYNNVDKDLITSTFRYRDSDPYVLLNQPAQSIISVVGAISGTLESDINYKFNKIDDILLEGNSTKASRNIQFLYANNMPAGEIAAQTESIVLVNNEFKPLLHKGIDIQSIIVKKDSIIYAINADYWIKEEEDGVNVSIARSQISTIPNGSTVSVEYEYGELLTITYTSLPLLNEVQNNIEQVRNAGADVLVKGVLETKIDYEVAVILKKGTDEIAAAVNIKNAIFAEHAKLRLGQRIAQSDVIRIIEEVNSVVSVLVPLIKMAKADNTQINRELITSEWTTYQSSVAVSFTTGPNALLQKTLGSNAGDGFYAVFEDDRPLILVTTGDDVDTAIGQAFISSEGEVFVSLLETSESPDSHNITVCYVVNGETGAKDIVISDLEYIIPGEVIVTTSVL